MTKVVNIPLVIRTHSLKVLDNYLRGPPKSRSIISAFSAHFQSPSGLYSVLVLGCAPSQHTERKEGKGKKSEVLTGGGLRRAEATLASVQGSGCTGLSPVRQVAGFLLTFLLAT